MADTVTSQTIQNGPRNLVMKFTNVSDGTGEAAVKKVDATSNTFAVNGTVPGVHLKIWKIEYDVKAMGLRLLWEASANTDIIDLGGYGTQDYAAFGGLPNPNAAGATGSILFTTTGAMPNSSYSVVLHMKKCV